MTDNEVKRYSEDNKLASKPMEETYKKRHGTADAHGHFMEINLLTLCKLRGDQQLKEFYLAGNLESAGDFDDVVIRYIDTTDRQNVIFLQSKSTQNENHQITITTFETGHDLPLQKYFTSFTQIQNKFKNPGCNDPIFGRNTHNLNCHFVIYTNRHADMQNHAVAVKNPFHFVLGGTHGQAFKLKVEKAVDLLLHDREIEQVLKLLKQILNKKCKDLERDDNFRMYHAFLAQTVLYKNGGHWKYRNDFLEGKFKNDVLQKFRERTFSWFSGTFMRNETYIDENKIKEHMKKRKLEVPTCFGITMLKLDTKLCDEFIKIVSDCISDNICTITQNEKECMNEVSKFVGNVLVFDEDKAMFKLNTEQLDKEPKKVWDYLINKLIELNIDTKLYFKIQLENFPRLSLGFARTDSKNCEEFINKLTILTGQPNVEGLKTIIRTSFGNVHAMEIAKYRNIIGKMTDWWQQSGETKYLRKDDGFMDGMLSGILFNVLDPLASFTGRTHDMEQLHATLQGKKDDNCTAVISGLGGIGKSELARKYVCKYRNSYGSIVWIDAEMQDTMGNCFRRLCKDCLKIPTQDANKMEMDMTSIVQEVYKLFENRNSLFVFDNAQYFKNDCNLIDGIENFWPATKLSMPMAHFLITSRNIQWPNAVLIELKVLNDAEAEKLVENSLQIQNELKDNDVKQLTNQLQNYPLALQQAVAYIRQKDYQYQKARGIRFVISDYLQLYKDKTKEFLNFKFPANCDDKYTKTTFMTWKITLAEIEKSPLGMEAREVFDIMAYLSPNDIQISFFSDIANDREKLDEVFILIEKYSMITLHNGMANIHRLVQSVTKLMLLDAEKQHHVLEKSLSLIRNHSDKELITQGASVWNYANNDSDLVIRFKAIPAKIIAALRRIGRFEEASAFGKVSLENLNSEIGQDHEETLHAQSELAHTLYQEGQYEQALSLYKVVFEQRTKVLGPNNPGTLCTQNSIANTLYRQGQYEEALSLYKEVSDKRREMLGPNHPDTLNTESDVADTLRQQGQNENAISLYKEAHV